MTMATTAGSFPEEAFPPDVADADDADRGELQQQVADQQVQDPSWQILNRRLLHLVRCHGRREGTSNRDCQSNTLGLEQAMAMHADEFGEAVQDRVRSRGQGELLASLDRRILEPTYVHGHLSLKALPKNAPMEKVVQVPQQISRALEAFRTRRRSKGHRDEMSLAVMVQEVSSPWDFWINLGANYHLLDKMMDKLNCRMRDGGPGDKDKIAWKSGDLCAGFFDGEWHRARVLEVQNDADPSSEETATLFFFDYGTFVRGIYSSDRRLMRPLPSEFSLLAAQGFRARLGGISPPPPPQSTPPESPPSASQSEAVMASMDWSDAARVRFLQLVRESANHADCGNIAKSNEEKEDKGGEISSSSAEGGIVAKMRNVRLDERNELVLDVDLVDISHGGRSLGKTLMSEGLAVVKAEEEEHDESTPTTDEVDESDPDPDQYLKKLLRDQGRILRKIRIKSRSAEDEGTRELLRGIAKEQSSIKKYLEKLVEAKEE